MVHPSFKIQALLRAVLRDEMIAWHKKTSDNPQPSTSSAEGVQQQVGFWYCTYFTFINHLCFLSRLNRKMEKWSSTLLGKQWQQSQQDWQVLVHLMELNLKLVSWWLQHAALTIYAEWTLHGILGCNHCSIYLLSNFLFVQSVHCSL